MEATIADRPKFRRCFVTGTRGPALHALIRMLEARGIEATSAEMLNPGTAITQEILRLIATSDFIAVVLTEGHRDNAVYELGVAMGQGKPAFVVLSGTAFPLDVTGVYVRAVEGLEHIGDAGEDLDRFLRNAKTPAPLVLAPTDDLPVDLGWAKAELTQLRRDKPAGREAAFERLVERIFDAAGAELLSTDSEREEQVDFVVWLDQVSAQTGGPLLVECKLFQGGSGSVIKNSEAFLRRLERTVEGTDSGLALLVYDHDRPNTPPSLYETPLVLSFAIEDLIRSLEKGALEKEVLRRRERAAFARRPG